MEGGVGKEEGGVGDEEGARRGGAEGGGAERGGAMHGEGCDWEEGRATGRRDARLGGDAPGSGGAAFESGNGRVGAEWKRADEWGWDGKGRMSEEMGRAFGEEGATSALEERGASCVCEERLEYMLSRGEPRTQRG